MHPCWVICCYDNHEAAFSSKQRDSTARFVPSKQASREWNAVIILKRSLLIVKSKVQWLRSIPQGVT